MTAAPNIELPKATAHPLVPWLSREEQLALIAAGQESVLLELWQEREAAIRLSEEDAYRHGFDLPHWKDARQLLRDKNLVYISGGKRASKSELAAREMVRAAVTYPQGKLWAFQDSIKTSISMQQALVWKYLPREYKALNGRRSHGYKINYTQAAGFALQHGHGLVLPNRTEIHFLTYNQDPKEYQGWEIGAPRRLVEGVREDLFERNLASARERGVNLDSLTLEEYEALRWQNVPENVAAWADENLTVAWLETIKFRSSTRGGKTVWTFSTTDGITPTIKEVAASAQTVEHRPSELLAGRVNVPDCPAGTMPYIQQPQDPTMGIIYFFTEWNPFSGYAEEGGIREKCQGRSSDYVMMNAYGYCRDTTERACPKFGSWNIIRPDEVPADVTCYTLTDPAGARNWATIWVAVDGEQNYYIYRDWPDAQRHGEWALPDDGQNPKPDGKPGPAQRSLGYGYPRYKKMLLAEEKGEKVYERYIDPRAGRNAIVAERGGTCIIDELAKPHELPLPDGTTETVNGMIFVPAAGKDEDDGIAHINDLLDWDMEAPMCAGVNAPRLWVTDNCQQVTWTLGHYTGRDGQKGACKDFFDLVRYMATSGLIYVRNGQLTARWGGSY